MRFLIVLAFVLSMALGPGSAASNAQCTALCGDLTENGFISSADMAVYWDYYRYLSWGGFDSACAEVDNHQGNSVSDYCRLMAQAMWIGPDLDCTPDSGTFVPIPNDSHYLHYNCIIPPGDTSITVYVEVTVTGNNLAVAVGHRFEVDGQTPTFGSLVVQDPPSWNLFLLTDPKSTPVPQGHLFARMFDHDPTHGAPPGRYEVCTVELLVPASLEYRVLTLEPSEWPPGDNTPMVVRRYTHDGWALNPDPITVALTGDTNNDRILSAADIIGLVNFVFKSGRTPYPVPAAGDINCSAEVTSSDIIGLVNYIFKSGTAPCDVEAECTINLDQWTCT